MISNFLGGKIINHGDCYGHGCYLPRTTLDSSRNVGFTLSQHQLVRKYQSQASDYIGVDLLEKFLVMANSVLHYPELRFVALKVLLSANIVLY